MAKSWTEWESGELKNCLKIRVNKDLFSAQFGCCFLSLKIEEEYKQRFKGSVVISHWSLISSTYDVVLVYQ